MERKSVPSSSQPVLILTVRESSVVNETSTMDTKEIDGSTLAIIPTEQENAVCVARATEIQKMSEAADLVYKNERETVQVDLYRPFGQKYLRKTTRGIKDVFPGKASCILAAYATSSKISLGKYE